MPRTLAESKPIIFSFTAIMLLFSETETESYETRLQKDNKSLISNL